MNRKDFLKNAALAAFSLTTMGFVQKTEQGDFVGDCETTNDILGPFFRENAPIRSDLLFEGLEGNRIHIKGNILGEDCTSPIKNAKIEIWHCDTTGAYDNHSKLFKHRGVQLTDKLGFYNFKTILPGKYLNGKLYRPSHIHFRVTAKGYKELISQIYFAGDPHIEADRWASTPNAKQRIVDIVLENTTGGLAVNFDIYLNKTKPTKTKTNRNSYR